MNTATTRIRAGAPAPIQTRRVEPSLQGLTHQGACPVKFANPCRFAGDPADSTLPHATQFAGLEPAEPEVETVEQYDNDATGIAWVGYVLIAAAVALISFAAGIVSVRLLP